MNKLLKARWEFGYHVWNKRNKMERLFNPWEDTPWGAVNFRMPSRSIRDLQLGKDYYIAGGAIRSRWDKLKTKDYDIYFYSYKGIAEYISQLTRYGNYKIERKGPVTTLNTTIQLIETDKQPEELMKAFDFRCNQFAYDGKVIATPEAQIDASLKILRFNPTMVIDRGYAFNPIQRTWHFRRRGYQIPDETIEMAYQLSKDTGNTGNSGGPN